MAARTPAAVVGTGPTLRPPCLCAASRAASIFRKPAFCEEVFFAAGFLAAGFLAAGAAVFLGVVGDVRADRSASAFRKDSFCAPVGVRRFAILRIRSFTRVGISIPSLLTDGYFFFRVVFLDGVVRADRAASAFRKRSFFSPLKAFSSAEVTRYFPPDVNILSIAAVTSVALIWRGGDVRAARAASAFRNAVFCAAVFCEAGFFVAGFFVAGFFAVGGPLLRTGFVGNLRGGVVIFLSSLRLLLRLLLRLRVFRCGLVSASSGRVWHDSSSMPPAYEASRCWHASFRWDPIGSR